MGAPKSQLAAITEPSRGAVAGVVLAVCVLLVVGAAIEGDNQDSSITFIALGILIVVSGIWFLRGRRAHSRWARRNSLDYVAGQQMGSALSAVAVRSEPTTDTTGGLSVIRDARVGEVSQHFDQRLEGSVHGWLVHELSMHGWGAGVAVGRVALGGGQRGLSGTSQVDLNASGVVRDDLAGDALVCVLEWNGASAVVDTVRMVVPSEPACREFVANLTSMIGRSYGEGSHVKNACERLAPTLAGSFRCDVPHASDQLRAILRQPEDQRPPVSIVGQDLGGSVMLGAAIRIGTDGPWQQLFPIERLRAIMTATQASTGSRH